MNAPFKLIQALWRTPSAKPAKDKRVIRFASKKEVAEASAAVVNRYERVFRRLAE